MPKASHWRLRPPHLIGLKVAIHLAVALPLLITLYQGLYNPLDADPVKTLLHYTGMGGLNLLLITLAIAPLAHYLRQPLLMQSRRLIGLYCFFYALCHLLTFILFELQFEWGLLLSEIIKRPYISVGFVALLILTLLALTSTHRLRRKMGQYWQQLHNLIYLAAILVALHFLWSVKSDIVEPMLYWLALLLLLSYRKGKIQRWLHFLAAILTAPLSNRGKKREK